MADERVIVQTPLVTPEGIEKTIRPYIVQKREVVTVEAPKQETGRNSIVITKTGLS